MYGAILGDIIGSPYECHNIKTTDFKLFGPYSRATDDSVMTLAIADGIMNAGLMAPADVIQQEMTKSMQKFGRKYPRAGYGGNFIDWIHSDDPQPYNSWGNGAAMRVTAIAWLFADDYAKMRAVARASAAITHNHPEGIKAADATVCLTWLAMQHQEKAIMKAFMEENFGYKLDKSCDEMRPEFSFDVSCQGTMPAAITAFLEGDSYENVVRLAISLGGDSDTIAAIAGGFAEAYYGIPEVLKREGRKRLPEDLLSVLTRYDAVLNGMLEVDHDGRREIPRSFVGFSDSKIRESSNVLAFNLTQINELVAQLEKEDFFIDAIELSGQGEWDTGIVEYEECYDDLQEFITYAKSDYEAVCDNYKGHKADWSETIYYLYHMSGIAVKIYYFSQEKRAHWILWVVEGEVNEVFVSHIEEILKSYSEC